MVSDSESTVVEIHLSPGNEHDAAHGRRSMAALGAFMGAHLLMDRAYEGDSTRLLAESFGLTPVVPPKKNRTVPWDYDREGLRGCGRKVGRFGVRIGVRMFSMEDRRRAVDLYFTEGMTIRKVVAELGYPSEGALVKWVREDPRYTGACGRSYTLECKTNAARRALGGESLARVARDAGCTPTSVYQWMRRYRSEGIPGLMGGRNVPMPPDRCPRPAMTWRGCAGRWRPCGWRTR